MSDQKRPEREKRDEQRTTADYYRLNKKAVDDLVTADETNSPQVSEEELSKYRSGANRIRFAPSLKILLIKFWFPAAVCYFFIWGLGTYVADLFDLLFVTGIGLGMVTDLLTNNVLRFIERSKGENDRWMMFPQKSYWTFPLNIVYAWVVLAFVFTIYQVINLLLTGVMHTPDAVPLGVEPILFGLFYMGCDMLLIACRHLFTRIVADAVKTTRRNGQK